MKLIKYLSLLSLTLVMSTAIIGCGETKSPQNSTKQTEHSNTKDKSNDNTNQKETPVPKSNITMHDQYGNKYKLADFKGKYVFLNFFASWCGPCKSELKDIEELYKKYGKNKKDIIVIGIANPKTDSNPNAIDGTKDEIIDVIKKYNVTYPVLFDETGEIFQEFGIRSFPTTFTLTPKNTIFGYVNGAMSLDSMVEAINKTQSGNK